MLKSRGRGWLMRWAARVLAGQTFRIHTNWGGNFLASWDDTYFLQLFSQEPLETAVAFRLMRPGSVFVDVGANRGWYTILAATRGMTVVSIEPSKYAFSLLRRNIKASGISHKVDDFRVAATNLDSEVGFLNVADNQLSRIALGGPGENGVEDSVQGITLATLLTEARVAEVDLIKIDVEGAEVRVIEGLKEATIGRPLLLVEAIESNLRRYGVERRDLGRAIQTVLGDYAALALCRRHGWPERLEWGSGCPEVKNVLFVPNERLENVLSRVFIDWNSRLDISPENGL